MFALTYVTGSHQDKVKIVEIEGQSTFPMKDEAKEFACIFAKAHSTRIKKPVLVLDDGKVIQE